jgi:hypothetical protein
MVFQRRNALDAARGAGPLTRISRGEKPYFR